MEGNVISTDEGALEIELWRLNPMSKYRDPHFERWVRMGRDGGVDPNDIGDQKWGNLRMTQTITKTAGLTQNLSLLSSRYVAVAGGSVGLARERTTVGAIPPREHRTKKAVSPWHGS